MENKLKIYKASAGSGKTHTLTEEFLKLAIIHPDNFKHILAVTFTNKAAEEMKVRILEALNDLVKYGSKAGFYTVFQESFPDYTEIDLLKRARIVRDNILHNYSFFSINTIDSFVQKVIRAFTFEIGVQSGYRIELDTEKVIEELTEMLSQATDDNEFLKNWLINFAHHKIDDGKSWDFRAEIKDLAKEIFKEQFQALESENSNDDKEEFVKITSYYLELQKIKNAFTGKLKTYSQKAKEILIKHTALEQNLGGNFKIIRNYLLKGIVENQDDKLLPNKTVNNAVDNVEKWYAKSASVNVKNTVTALFHELNPILKDILSLLDNHLAEYISANNILSNFHAFGILTSLANLLPEYRHDNNLLLISDTTRILKELVAGNDAPFIYEKIGNKYRHLLIDEFQDTSGFQWENFKPLIKNSLSENNANLIVGDIKQSIYRWRGGDWRLLLKGVEQDIGKFYIENKNLDTNWRSKKNIVDFNNYIFKNAAQICQNIFNVKLSSLSENDLIDFGKELSNIILNSYKDTYQKLPEKTDKKGGRVRVEFIEQESRSKNEYKEKVLELLPQRIEELILKRKFSAGDIAVLVRTNKQGKEVAEILLDYMSSPEAEVHYPIISSESLFLSNSYAVRILVDALYFINNQDDNLHLTALASEIIRYQKNKSTVHNHFEQKNIEQSEIIPKVFFDELENLKKNNLFQICEQLIDIFGLKSIKDQNAYIQTFQEVLKEFTGNDSVDIEQFLKWWEERGKNKSVLLSDQDSSLKIMTIHKSKGLAFGVVILPFFDWGLEKSALSRTIIWTHPKKSPFNKFEFVPLVYRSALSMSTFKQEYYEETLYTLMDALNMMYVAFTRPKEELIVFAPFNSKLKEAKSVADLLQLLLSDKMFVNDEKGYIPVPEFFNANENILEISSDDKTYDKKNETNTENSFELDEYPVSDWTKKLNILHHAEDFFIQSIKYIEDKVNYGNLMHELFARIKIPEDIDYVLNEQYYEGKINSKELDNLRQKIKSIIEDEKVADWFSAKWKVKNEDAILDEDGSLKIPDRVLIGKDKTIVIDFKFGKARTEHHEQVKNYMELLQKMNYPNVEAYLYYAENRVVEKIK
ncbi:MAG: UvrD-helicase domain-containing protein [Bacteroidales bacterium]|nr:UvrD-helicase domain-containing protein [Bacteroidales bacterium]